MPAHSPCAKWGTTRRGIPAHMGKCTRRKSSRTSHLRMGNKLAWCVRFSNASVECQPSELPASDCNYKVEGDHAIMSRLARVVNKGVDPDVVAAAKAMLVPQSKWVVDGKMAEHRVIAAIVEEVKDAMAVRTIPRCVWMTPDWVACAREIITTRANNPKFRDDERRKPMSKDIDYIFAEEFTDPPRYASPTGRSGGFWIVWRHGTIKVGFGTLPAEYGEPDLQTKGQYIPTLAGGRTVNAALNKEEQALVAERAANTPKMFNGKPTFVAIQKVNKKKGSGPMPMAMGIVMMPMHDELSLRSSGEIVSDFDPSVPDGGAAPFDRSPDYVQTWARYDKVDVYGQPLAWSKL
eukprot:gnl/TRDRNA2_/TRDRNA2_157914_c0_seq3.p1 gnl/TRDRNA2_/TRDRNA2_157914_c0~~gnl/TRDRNA2_/TRDRNA2_157914_c0_seq3.p1  ORF type:complete len:349 (-),score=71.26 gnl/TRDRNA2_/TRDRNA2_157914_c0_seq3:87-1133(-)